MESIRFYSRHSLLRVLLVVVLLLPIIEFAFSKEDPYSSSPDFEEGSSTLPVTNQYKRSPAMLHVVSPVHGALMRSLKI